MVVAGHCCGAHRCARGRGVLVVANGDVSSASCPGQACGGASQSLRRRCRADHPEKPSIVVLPFDNLSDDKEQGYLADGITEDLTTELARIPDLFVISRNAAFTYKDKSLPPAAIATELGVSYLLEGSIRRVGDDIRINAQLIDGSNSGHMWAERFDGQWSKVFDLQDEMVRQIATALKLRLVESQRAAQIAGGTSNPAAYDAWLRGLELEHRGTPEDIAKAATSYQQAVALDPDYGRAWASLAWLFWDIHGVEQEQALGLTWPEIQRKLDEALKRPSPTYYQILAARLVRQQRSDEAIAALEKAIALNSSNAWSYESMSSALTFNGRPAEGRGYIDAAARVDPAPNGWRHYLVALAYFSMDRFDEAVASIDKIEPGSREYGWFWINFHGLMLGISAYGHLGQTDKTAALRARLDPMLKESDNGEFTGQLAQVFFVYKNYADTERLLEGLRKAGVPELAWGFDPKSKDRLTGEEIRRLTFGHQFEGRLLNTGEPYSRTTDADGFAQITMGLEIIAAPNTIEGDTMCLNRDPTIGQRACSAIFRNPGGSAARKNEYLLFNHGSRFEFSVLKGTGEESAAQAYRVAAAAPRGGAPLHDEAIANLERAVELEPENSQDLWSVAEWLILAGRVPDAKARINSAIKLDPGSEAANCAVAGLLRFAGDRFEEAAATLETCAADHPYDSDIRLLLTATYGQLGRAVDAAPHYAKVRGGEPWTIMLAGQRFPFKLPDDARRLRQGLLKAGVAELPEPYDAASGDRLSGDEIRSLVLGHTLNYRNIGIERGMKASTAFSTNGDATLSRPDGVKSGIYIREWASIVDDNAICIAWEAFGLECAAIFRNPKGTAAEENEFLWINEGNPWSFSIAR